MFNFIGGNMRTDWLVAHGILDTPGIRYGQWGRGVPAALPARRGMYPGLGRIHSFISRSRVSHCRRIKRKQGTGVLSGPVHSIARHKWQPKVRRGAGGREERGRGMRDRDPKGEPAPRSDLSLYCIAIDLAFTRGYRESDSHGAFYKPTMGIVPLIVHVPTLSLR